MKTTILAQFYLLLLLPSVSALVTGRRLETHHGPLVQRHYRTSCHRHRHLRYRHSTTRFLSDGNVFDWANNVAMLASSTLLISHGAEATTTTAATGMVPILPVVGSSAIMLTIVALLYLWEKSIESVRETVPPAVLPVVESILAEMGGLGFIGLLFQTFGGALPLDELSTLLFGEDKLLIETFEFLHLAFFQVGVGFFIAAGAMVAVGLKKLDEIQTVESLRRDVSTSVCTVTTTQLAALVPLTKDPDQLPENNLVDEIFMPASERGGKVLLMRSRLMETHELPDTFSIEKYVQGAFAKNLLYLVELSPLTWIYLIPALALADSIDLSHDVVNAASPNAFESAGYFFSTPWAIGPSVFSVGLSWVWGLWNCWKMTKIKYMINTRLGHDKDTGELVIFPPPMESDTLRAQFIPISSPAWVQPIEAIWAKPARTSMKSCLVLRVRQVLNSIDPQFSTKHGFALPTWSFLGHKLYPATWMHFGRGPKWATRPI
jgi:hypothetical protein